MMIKCPECGLDISDRAYDCPHCGYPLRERPSRKKRTPVKRMRLPNGFGRITEIKGKNLRKPFRAMVSFGKDENGKPIGRLLKPQAYFATYNEAYAALLSYHSNPYEIENDITIKDVYEKWFAEKEKTLSKSRIRNIKSSWNYFVCIEDTKIQHMKVKDIKNFIDNCYRVDPKTKVEIKPTDRLKFEIRHLLEELFAYALEYDFIRYNYMNDIRSREKMPRSEKSHITFTDEEMNILREHVGEDLTIDMMLFQCYTGLRPDEMCNIKIENVNLEEWFFVAGNKTAAGINRKIPVHPRIRGIFEREYKKSIEENNKYLFTSKGARITYEVYRKRFIKIINQFSMNDQHAPHDCRKQFVSMAKAAEMDEYAIKRIVGHSIQDVTEAVYTERNIKWLHKELAKMY